MYTVITVPAFSDNYIWLIRHENHCLVVDPGEAAPVLERLAAYAAFSISAEMARALRPTSDLEEALKDVLS